MRKKTSGEQPVAAEPGKELGKPKRRSSLSASFRLPSVRVFHCNSKFQKNKTQNRRLVTTRQRQELYSLNQLMTRLEKEAFARVGSQLWSHLTISILDIRYNDFLNKSPSSCRFVRSGVTAKVLYNAFLHIPQFLSFSLPLPSNHQPSAANHYLGHLITAARSQGWQVVWRKLLQWSLPKTKRGLQTVVAHLYGPTKRNHRELPRIPS